MRFDTQLYQWKGVRKPLMDLTMDIVVFVNQQGFLNSNLESISFMAKKD